MTETPAGRTATALDVDVRRHLAILLTGAQCGTDEQVVLLARNETHRLVGAVIAGLRYHAIGPNGDCTVCCGRYCRMRGEMSNALLPIRRLPLDGG